MLFSSGGTQVIKYGDEYYLSPVDIYNCPDFVGHFPIRPSHLPPTSPCKASPHLGVGEHDCVGTEMTPMWPSRQPLIRDTRESRRRNDSAVRRLAGSHLLRPELLA